jgi:hypothetical protein
VVVVVGKNLPVGKGVLRADRLSGQAEVGQPCVSQRFWKSLDDHEKEDWLSNPIPEDAEVLKVQKRVATGDHSQRAGELASAATHRTGTAQGPVPDLDRRALVETLKQLDPSDFASVVTRIPGAARYVSRHGTVPEQAAELFRWAESPTGPGLDAIREALNFR